MIKHCRTLLHGAALALAISSPAYAIDSGARAPAITAQSASGAAVQISAQPGKVLYLDFWASWCGPCRQSFPWMNAMQAKYRDLGLEIVGINLDAEAGDAVRFLKQVPADFSVAYDPQGNSALQYGVKGMPTSVLIGRDGRVIQTHMGFNASSGKELEAAFRKALELGQ